MINFLGAFVGEDFNLAHQYIEQAGDPSLWSNTNGLEVIALLHGNMEIRRARVEMVNKNMEEALGAIEEAKSHFNEAAAISIQNGHGTYARAYLGLAVAEGLAASTKAIIRGDTALIDTEAIDRSMDYLTQAEKADYQPEAADIPVKANYARAQAALTYYAKTRQPAYLENGRKYYQLVVDEFESTNNKRIVEVAALSYSGLAQIVVELSRIEVENDGLESAAQYFLSAQSITGMH
jgi:hypothetical protein